MFLNNFFKNFKYKKAQSAVEFALVAPIFVMFLFIIIEFGYAMSARNALATGAKEALIKSSAKYNNLIGDAAAKRTVMQNNLKTEMQTYLAGRGIPNISSVSVKVTTNANGITMVTFTYMYKLSLASFIPGVTTIPLQSSQVINTQLVKQNNFSSGLSTRQLSSFFPTPSSALTSGGMINDKNSTSSGYAIRNNTAILVNYMDDEDVSALTVSVYARLFSWYGRDLLPPNMRVNVRKATLEVRSPYYNSGNWLDTKIPYVWVASALGYTQIFFVKYNSSVDQTANNGFQLNSCINSTHYWADSFYGVSTPANICPQIFGQGSSTSTWYPYLYTIYPLAYSESDHDQFAQSNGYRWCGASGLPACSTSQFGSHDILELALKGLSRNSWKCVNHGLDFTYDLYGNYDTVENFGATNINSLQHYSVRSSNYGSFDGKYLINIFQPIVTRYYLVGTDNANPEQLEQNDAETTFYTAFKWKIDLNSSGVCNPTASGTTELTDVYLDNDGDGIPNAWDNHPLIFDMDSNGQLDGLQKNFVCPICGSTTAYHAAIDNTNIDNGYALSTAYTFPVPGITPYISTPFVHNSSTTLTGTLRNSKKTNASLTEILPELYVSDFRVYNGKLYLQCNNQGSAMDDLCRSFPGFTSLSQKERFINGTISGTDIALTPSEELNYLYNNSSTSNNSFHSSKRITRSSGGW